MLKEGILEVSSLGTWRATTLVKVCPRYSLVRVTPRASSPVDADHHLAMHLNFWLTKPGEKELDKSNFDKVDQQAIDLLVNNKKWAFAYNHEHATKTSTIATVVSSNPISLLAWQVTSSLLHPLYHPL